MQVDVLGYVCFSTTTMFKKCFFRFFTVGDFFLLIIFLKMLNLQTSWNNSSTRFHLDLQIVSIFQILPLPHIFGGPVWSCRHCDKSFIILKCFSLDFMRKILSYLITMVLSVKRSMLKQQHFKIFSGHWHFYNFQ